MRVISGFLKGRNIKGYDIVGTRPTMDRVKESIFATIQDKIANSTVLDLFAGCGTYGIEAISNQAKIVYFNDINKKCCDLIKNSLQEFQVSNKGIVLNLDYLKCLNYLKSKNLQFDLIFLDPPYKLHVLNDILKYISSNSLLAKNGLVIVEFEDEDLLEKDKNIIRFKEKKYGSKIVYIYRRLDNE